MENYEKLKEIIWKVNPTIKYTENLCSQCDGTQCNGLVLNEREIRLADVCWAIHMYTPIKDLVICPNGEIYRDDDWQGFWEMKDDNLENQSEETKQFLIDLLVK